jgi:hypothetical protein
MTHVPKQIQAVLDRIIEENPKAGREKWWALFDAEVRADPDLREAMLRQWYDDTVADILRSKAN